MRIIHKQKLEGNGFSGEFLVPAASVVPRTVADQRGTLVLWFERDSLEGVFTSRVSYIIAATGQAIHDEELAGFMFVGTAMQDWLVWHVYVKVEEL